MNMIDEFEKMSLSCGVCVKNGAVLNWVLTATEITTIFPVEDSTLRNWVRQGVFQPNEFKGGGKVLIFTLSGVLRVLKEKGMYNKLFIINERPVNNCTMIYKERVRGGKNPLTIWLTPSRTDIFSSVFQRRVTENFISELKKMTENMLNCQISTLIICDSDAEIELDGDVALVPFSAFRKHVEENNLYSEEFIKQLVNVVDSSEYVSLKLNHIDMKKERDEKK